MKKKTVTAKDSALRRKKRTEKYLKSLGVSVDESLPVLAEQKKLGRPKSVIVRRALALLLVAIRAEGLDKSTCLEIVGLYELKEYLSKAEYDFIFGSRSFKTLKDTFTWRYESAWVLLWVLGFVKELEAPSHTCNADKAFSFFELGNIKKIIAAVDPRPLSQILDQADLAYRSIAALSDANTEGEETIADFVPGVVIERASAFYWLLTKKELDWDEVVSDLPLAGW